MPDSSRVARGVVGCGIATFPLDAKTKTPLTVHGFHDRTSDARMIELWIEQFPGCLWGIVPADLGAIVFDVDKPATFRIAERAGVWPAAGLKVKTPNGWHLYFRKPDDLRGGRPILPEDVGILGRDRCNVVVRIDVGYVVAPGCVRADGGRYIAHGRLADLAPLPDATAQLLRHLGDPERRPRDAGMSPPPAQIRSEASVIEAFNDAHNATAILEAHGYRRRGKRWIAPNSESGLPGVVALDDRIYSHHATDPLNDGHAHDAFSLFTVLEHRGDVRAAVRAAAETLGVNRPIASIEAIDTRTWTPSFSTARAFAPRFA